MNAIQWLLDRLGRRLIAWSVALNRRDRDAPPPPPAAPDEPFDAKQHWLDRVAHLPPQAWRQGGRPVPPRRAPASAAAPQHDAPPTLPSARRAHDPASTSPAVAAREVGPLHAAPRRAAMRSGPAAWDDLNPTPIARAAPDAMPSPNVAHAVRSPSSAPPIQVARAAQPSAPVPPGSGRVASPAQAMPFAWPPEREPGPPPRVEDASLSSLAPTLDARERPHCDQRPAFADHVDHVDHAGHAGHVDHAVSATPSLDHDARHRPPPIAAFDPRRTHAPELARPTLAQAAPQSRALPRPRPAAPLDPWRVERELHRDNGERATRGASVDPDAPAHGWPGLPPWPEARDPQARVADPHARDRRRRLDHEQRG